MKRVLALMLLLVAPLLVAQEQTTPPTPSAPREPKIPKPVEKTLANGLRVIVVPRANIPLVAARLMIRTGSEADPNDRAGLAQMTADLLTQGTTTRSAEQIARGVEALGATLAANAGWDRTAVDLSVMSSKLPQAMAFVADVVRHPAFKKTEIERVREQSIDSLRVELQQPNSLAGFVATRVLFRETPYGHNAGGLPESLARITRADLVKFHKQSYTPDNAVLVLGGDVKPSAAFALAEKLFGAWKGSQPKVGLASLPPSSTPRVVVVDMPDAGQAAVVVARPGLRRIDPAYNPAQVANAVLGGGYSSRLNEEIRIKRGLSYGAGSNFDFRQFIGPFTASAQTKNESAAEVAGIIVDEMTKLGAAPLPDVELGPRKAILIGDFGRALETRLGLVLRVAALALYGLGLDEIQQYIRGVDSVTAADVQKFAASHLAGADASVVIVGDAKKFLGPLKARFKEVDVIPIDQLDLSSPTLRKKT